MKHARAQRTSSCLALLLAGWIAGCSERQSNETTVPPAGSDPAYPAGSTLPAQGSFSFSRVVLVTIDTLRADHVGSYGYPRDVTPLLDKLAAKGVRFAQALSTVAHTAPSHASMFTGLSPTRHGLRRNGQTLADFDGNGLVTWSDLIGTSQAFGNSCEL